MFDEKRGSSAEIFLRDVMLTMRILTREKDNFWHCNYFIPHFPKAGELN